LLDIEDDGASLHVPRVDVMISQIADPYGATAIGVILTGMGQDGIGGFTKA
jgi:chemotaxis response regulator CheB